MRGAKGRRVSENTSAPCYLPHSEWLVARHIQNLMLEAEPSHPSLTGPPLLLCEMPLEADTWDNRAGLSPAWSCEAAIGHTHILCGG